MELIKSTERTRVEDQFEYLVGRQDSQAIFHAEVRAEIQDLLKEIEAHHRRYYFPLVMYIRRFMALRISNTEKFEYRNSLIKVIKESTIKSSSDILRSVLAGLCESSWMESVVGSTQDLDGVFGDAYEKSAFQHFQEKKDVWRREDPWVQRQSLRQKICLSMEEYCMQAYQEGNALLIKDEEGVNVWLVKHHSNGGSYGEFTVLVHLNTGEVYTPNKAILTAITRILSMKTHQVVQLSCIAEEIGSDEMLLHFTRLVDIKNENFVNFRKELLEKYSTLVSEA